MTTQLHLVGAKTANQMAAHAALVQAALKAQKDPPKAPVLIWDNFSGRGVRVRILDPDERDKVAEIVAGQLGENTLVTDFNRVLQRACVHKCIVAVTKERELDEERLAKATWVTVTEEQLEEPKGALSAKTLFTAKDMGALIVWYRQQHEISVDDMAAIMGKARELAE